MSYFQFYFFFFSSRRRHTRYIGDWSSDVCSSDLGIGFANQLHVAVLDSVVHHLDVMTGAVRAHVSTARFAIHLGGNLAENFRSEERRVGKECRYRWSPNHSKKKKT